MYFPEWSHTLPVIAMEFEVASAGISVGDNIYLKENLISRRVGFYKSFVSFILVTFYGWNTKYFMTRQRTDITFSQSVSLSPYLAKFWYIIISNNYIRKSSILPSMCWIFQTILRQISLPWRTSNVVFEERPLSVGMLMMELVSPAPACWL